MKHKKQLWGRQRITLVSLGVWFVGWIGIFTWAGLQSQQFRVAAHDFAGSVQKILDAANNTFKKAKEANDLSATQAALTDLAGALDQKRHSAPAPPHILGLHIGADAEREKQSRLVVAMQKSTADLQLIAAYADYQQKTSVQLQLLSLKSAANYDQYIALADAWRGVAADLSANKVPTPLTEVNATLVQKATDMQNHMLALADLFKKVDEAGFAAKKADMANTVESFKAIGTNIARIAAGLDAALATHLADIRKNL